MTDYLRKIFSKLLDAFAGRLLLLGFKPNTITILGLLGVFLASFLIAKGEMVFGGLMVLAMASLDAVDGSMARLANLTSDFGAFLDSVADRYAEFAIFFGILIYGYRQQNSSICILSFLAASGSILVSYTRSRAEALGVDVKIGILTRVERFLILIPSLLLNKLEIGLMLIAILGHLTSLQRILYTRKKLKV